MIRESFRAFASGLIDYAGLFPPAELAMDVSIRNYARYRSGPEEWILGRFLCPASRLDELAPFRDSVLRDGEPFRFSVISRGGKDGHAFRAGLGRDIEAITHFRTRHPGRIEVEAVEARIPDPLVLRPEGGALIEMFDAAADLLEGQEAPAVQLFYEAPFIGEWRQNLSWIIDAIGAHSPASWGFKLRCGGTTAAAVPSVEQIAFTILACRDAGVPLKATAGLHQAIRRPDDALGVKVHGFLNLFGAGLLAWAHDLDEETIAAVVGDERADDFAFEEGELAWRDLKVPAEEIAALRHGSLVSFGSCSFDEPCEEMRSLGWIDGRGGEGDNGGAR